MGFVGVMGVMGYSGLGIALGGIRCAAPSASNLAERHFVPWRVRIPPGW
ncbi:MAG: hypothetical protein GY869_23640 [Planctomycetes bacterium]|nr:hypothetical protein [Planctomycetota bacterium]